MTFAMIWMAVIVVVVVAGLVLMTRQRDRAWKQLAAEVGGEFVGGGLFRSSKVQVPAPQGILTLDTYSVPAGDSSTTYTRLMAPLQNKDDFQFKLSREGLGGKLEKILGAQDIEIGVPDFDEAFVIQGNNPVKVQSLLADAKIRQLIQTQRGIHLSVKGEVLRFEAQGVIKDVPRLKSLFELFRALLEKLGA